MYYCCGNNVKWSKNIGRSIFFLLLLLNMALTVWITAFSVNFVFKFSLGQSPSGIFLVT